MLGQATMGSATIRTTSTVATKNAPTMQAGKTNEIVDPFLRTSAGGILNKEGLTSARVTP